jgi:type VI secretion system protein ImpA
MFLDALSESSVCGDDLEYNPEFQEMVRSAMGEPERQVGDSIIPAEEPDWPLLRRVSLRLLETTRDIRVSVYLTQAEAKLNGFQGVCQGLALTYGLLERFWDCVHPQQDPEDSYPVLRMNTLTTLNDFDRFLSIILSIPLTASRLFSVDLRKLNHASGKIKTSTEGTDSLSEPQIQAAFKDSDHEVLLKNKEYVKTALIKVEQIQALTVEKVGAMNAPDLAALVHVLQEIDGVYEQYASARKSTNDLSIEHHSIAETPVDAPLMQAHIEEDSVAAFHSINSRKDVSQAIDLICEYYKNNEPTSPVPLLLNRVKGLLYKDFIEILEDLAPEGVNQALLVLGSGENIHK